MRAEENPVAAEKPKRKTTSGRADENGLTLTEQVLAEIRRGGSNRAIAARVGCHAAYVSTVAQRHGLSRSLARPEAEVATSVRHMVEMDGPTLLKEMRKTNPDLKIIFVSGYAEDAFEKSLPEGQQFNFLAKPFTLSQLVAAVKETMSAGS